jgi:hypothetical protein
MMDVPPILSSTLCSSNVELLRVVREGGTLVLRAPVTSCITVNYNHPPFELTRLTLTRLAPSLKSKLSKSHGHFQILMTLGTPFSVAGPDGNASEACQFMSCYFLPFLAL